MSTPALPVVYQGTIDETTARQVLADIAALARVLSVQVKGAEHRHARGGMTLDAASTAWQAGAVGSLQVRYHHDGSEWCDTLLRGPAGIRIVRIRSEDAPGSASASTEPPGGP
jgi:hypothetical protein